MSNFTYESADRKTRLETFEWDNVWWEHTEIADAPRVLYIGDSISCATRRVATAAAENKILFDGFGTSKAIDNPYFADSVRIFAAQQGRRDAIIFNNGLHGWHLDDESEYREHYENFLKFLMSEYPETPVFVVLTTAVTNDERNLRVIKRNEVVTDIAKKLDLPIIDLYAASTSQAELHSPDGVHLNKLGYDILANEIVKALKANVPTLG